MGELENPEGGITDEFTNDRPIRTDIYCHSCDKSFIAEIDYSLEGNHKIECPFCYHIHYRVIKKGRVTEDRHDSDNSSKRNHIPRRIWKHNTFVIETKVASEFIRNKWLSKLT